MSYKIIKETFGVRALLHHSHNYYHNHYQNHNHNHYYHNHYQNRTITITITIIQDPAVRSLYREMLCCHPPGKGSKPLEK